MSAELAAFRAERYRRTVVALGVVTGDAGAAEDAVCEAMARACAAQESGTEIADLGGWIYTVALNIERSRFRNMAVRERNAELDQPAPAPDVVDASLTRSDVAAGVRSLPRRQREVVVMAYYLDMPLAQIAQSLSISVGATKNALFNGRQALATELAHLQPGKGDEHV